MTIHPGPELQPAHDEITVALSPLQEAPEPTLQETPEPAVQEVPEPALQPTRRSQRDIRLPTRYREYVVNVSENGQ